ASRRGTRRPAGDPGTDRGPAHHPASDRGPSPCRDAATGGSAPGGGPRARRRAPGGTHAGAVPRHAGSGGRRPGRAWWAPPRRRGDPRAPTRWTDRLPARRRGAPAAARGATRVVGRPRPETPAGPPPSGDGPAWCPGGPGAYCTVSIIPKIGRYIATIIPPTTTPRTRIITGSSSDSSPETATSTSSSEK